MGAGSVGWSDFEPASNMTEKNGDQAIASPAAALWKSAYALLTLTCLFWAGNAIVGRAARDLVPPIALSFWRWALALLLLLPIAWPYLKRDREKLLKHWKSVLLLGGLGVGSFNSLLYSSLQHTTAINALLIQASQPALILALGALAFHDPTTRAQIGGVLLSVAGALTIVSAGDPHILLNLRLNIGDALVAIAAMMWAFYSVLLRKRPDVHPLSFLAASIIAGVSVIFPFYIAEIWAGQRIVAAPESWAAIAYVAVFPSLISYLLFNRGVELIGSARAGQFLNLMPAMGAIMSIVILGESFHAFHAVGIFLIGAGIGLATWKGRSTRRSAASIQG